MLDLPTLFSFQTRPVFVCALLRTDSILISWGFQDYEAELFPSAIFRLKSSVWLKRALIGVVILAVACAMA